MGLVSQKPEVSRAVSTEPASPVQEHLIWEKPVCSCLKYVGTGGCVYSLHLVILPLNPLDYGHDFLGGVHTSLWRPSKKSPTIPVLGGGTSSISDFSIQPAESHSNHNTPAPSGTINPSSLLLSTNPAVVSMCISVGWVVLPQGDYSSPSRCHATQLSLEVARWALEVHASEIDRSGRCEFPLQQNQNSLQFVRDIDMLEDCDYDCVEDCWLVACWLGLAQSMMKE